ncbi:hypothetical protein K438DRAFT_1994709 [Mycena galopus ATCC 62051]|nr:hypothetical protein K438DRAFT_1994709 [Mycena galopus ATCC 62051]
MIPQELIEAIVSNTDTDSLIACSLVSSGFRAASHRLLFRTLRLEGHPFRHYQWTEPEGRSSRINTRWTYPNYSRACTLLTDSPHLAAYISDLEIYGPSPSISVDELDGLRRVLTKLVHVQHCFLHAPPGTHWSEFPQSFCLDVLDFLSRQRLDSLRVSSLKEIPPQVFLAFITAAPRLQFCFHCERWGPTELPAISPPPYPTLTQLLLGENADSVGELLSHPQFAAHIATLQRLSIRILKQPPTALLSVAKATLAHVYFDCRAFNQSHFSVALPALPHLCSLAILLDVSRRAEPWVIESISQILASNSNAGPEKITISYSSVGRYRASDLYMPMLQTLETLLLSHSAIPSLVWRLGYGQLYVKEKGFANFAYLVDLLRAATPTLHAMGKLAIEKFVLDWQDTIR